jgi:modification methylase
MRSSWTDIRGQSTRNGHPAPYPLALAERLIKMFSFAGDTVLDPFVGTGTTSLAALNTGRNSIGVEVERKYLAQAHARLRDAVGLLRESGPARCQVFLNGNP